MQFPIIFLGVTEIQQNLKDDLNSTLGFLDQFLSESKWVAGDNVTIADTSIYASLSSILVSIKLPRNLLDLSLVNLSKPTQMFLQAVGWNISKFPNILRWVQQCESLPGFAENEEGAKAFGEAVKKNLKQ